MSNAQPVKNTLSYRRPGRLTLDLIGAACATAVPMHTSRDGKRSFRAREEKVPDGEQRSIGSLELALFCLAFTQNASGRKSWLMCRPSCVTRINRCTGNSIFAILDRELRIAAKANVRGRQVLRWEPKISNLLVTMLDVSGTDPE